MRRVVDVRVAILGCFFLVTSIYAVSCPKGTFISKSSNFRCEKCPKGTYSNSINSTECRPCGECRGRHNLVTQACNLTSNTICKCEPGYFYFDEVLFCLKCLTCGKGKGVKQNCTSNSNTVCRTCVRGRTYSNTRDLTTCKSCTRCREGDIIIAECTRKSDSICERDSNDSKDKQGPNNSSVWPTISKPYRTTTNGSWIPSSTAIQQTPVVQQDVVGQQESMSTLVIAFTVLLCVACIFFIVFTVVLFRCKRKWEKAEVAEVTEVAEEGTVKTNLTGARENPYSSLPFMGGRQGRQATGPTSRPGRNRDRDLPHPPCQDVSSLDERCIHYLSHGLVMSSQRVYLSAQRRFIAFCKQDIKKVPDGFPLPADEHTLMRFCTMLADTVNYPSIKIYLSAVRSLHTDNGLPDPLINCLQLQNLLKGVKKVKDASTPARLLITVELMRAIHQSLDLSDQDHMMVWAACCLGYFGFLRIGEFTVNSEFDPDIHMTINDVEIDSKVNRDFFKVHVKCSKTEPFREECHIYVGRGDNFVCPFVAISNYLELRGPASGPLFLYRDNSPLSRETLSSALRPILQSAGFWPDKYSDYSFRNGAAKTAASRGVSEDLIKTLCRTSVDAYEAYSRMSVRTIRRVTSQIV